VTFRKIALLLPLLPLLLLVTACDRDAGSAEEPRLVVMIAVDQLRADLLDRYDEFFTGGFRRLMDEGARFDGVQDHAGTSTAPGHAAISTGVHPSRNGIVGNDWKEWVNGEWVDVHNVGDSLSTIVGFAEKRGISPRNLVRTGIADWLAEARPGARIVSIGGKDRSAILLAGQTRGDFFWFDHDAGQFITSTYYMDAYPEWVEQFNREQVPAYFDSVWHIQAPAAARALANPDTFAYEADGVHTYFPHRHSVQAPNVSVIKWAERTPFADAAVLGLAAEAIRVKGLGQDEVTDFLGVGLAQADRVGHRFGATSHEQLDNLLRLDRALGEFFEVLDREVGPGRWVAAFSADHGALTMPEWRVAQGEPGYRVSAEERRALADAVAAAVESAPEGEEAEAAARAARQFPFVAHAIPHEEMLRGTAQDSFVRLARNSYYPGRIRGELATYGIDIRPTEGTYVGGATGSGHGSTYYYDRSVPVIFLGGGTRAQRSREVVRTIDVAPTMAALAGIPAPDDLDGRALFGSPRRGTVSGSPAASAQSR
jgi:hypothetical protein